MTGNNPNLDLVVDLFIVTPTVGVCNCSMFCFTLLYIPSSFAIILMGKRELVALLSLSSWCLLIVVWLFLTVPWVCLDYFLIILTIFWFRSLCPLFYNKNTMYKIAELAGCVRSRCHG